MKKWIKNLVKLLFSVFFILILFHQVEITKLLEIIKDISLIHLSLIIPLAFAGHLIRSLAWSRILKRETSKMFKFTLSLISVNIVLPMKAGRMGAPFLLKSFFPSLDKERGISITIVTTFFYGFLYGIFTIFGVLVLDLPIAIESAALIGGFIYLSIAFVLILSGETSIGEGKLQKFVNLLPQKIKFKIEDVKESFGDLVNWDNTITYIIAWIIIYLPLQALRVYLIFGAFGFAFPNPILLLIVPLVAYSVTIIPISLGGVGLAELSASVVYQAFGIAPSLAISVALVDRFVVMYLPSIIGAIFLTRID